MSDPQKLVAEFENLESQFIALQKNNPFPLGENYIKIDHDFLFGLPEKLYKSTILIQLYDYLINNVPMYDLNDENLTELGMDKSKDKDDIDKIQEINQQIIELGKKAQLFCKQQYIINRHTLDVLDDILNNEVLKNGEEIHIDDDNLEKILNSMMSGVNKTIDNQKGGANELLIIKMMLIFILLINNSSNAFIKDLKNPSGDTSSKAIQPTSTELYVERGNTQLATLLKEPVKVSETVSTSSAVQIYNAEKNKTEQGRFAMITTLGGFLVKISAEDKLKQIVEEFNEKSVKFEQNSTEICKNLIKETQQQKIFLNFKQITTQEDIQKTTEDLKKMNNEIMTKTNEEITDYIFSLGLGFATGDVTTIMGSFSHLFGAYFDEPSAYAEEVENYNKMTGTAQGEMISAKDKDILEGFLSKAGRTACSASFHIQLKYDNNEKNIIVLGDRITYEEFSIYIETIVKNIELSLVPLISKAGSGMKLTDAEKAKLNVLISLKERLEVLVMLINSLNEIVNFAGYAELNKRLEINPGPQSFDEVRNFFNTQLESLQELLNQLHQDYPLQLKMLREQKEATEARRQLDELQRQIEIEEMEEESRIKLHKAQLNANSTKASAEAAGAQIKAYFDIAEFTMEATGKKFGDLTQTFAKAIASGPLGIVKALGDVSSDLLKYLFMTPGGLSILCVFLSSLWLLGFWQIAGVIKFVRTAWGFIICIVRGPFYLFYYLIKTPYGLICRFAGCFYKKPDNNNLLIENAPPAPEAPLLIEAGVNPPANANPNATPDINQQPVNERGGYKRTKNNKNRYRIQKHTKKQKKNKNKTLKKKLKSRKHNKTHKRYKKHKKTN